MVRRLHSPSPILASNWSEATKRKATTENEPQLKRHRGGRGHGANINSGKSTLESVPKVKSSSDKSTVLSGHTSRADFEVKYLELEKLGQGGFGSVYAGHRRSDDLPVAIKHIPSSTVPRQRVMLNKRAHRIPKEVLLMQKAAGEPVSMGRSAAVSLLDWYDLDQEVILVMERPVPSMELLHFINNNFGPLDEDIAQIIMKQLVDGAIDFQAKGVFHRDIKAENILIEFSSNGFRVRFIDFGCGCFKKKNCVYRQFSGTSAYAPPEFEMNGRYMAGPTTVWQLASLLFEMLAGSMWFHTKDFIRNEIQIWFGSKQCQDFLVMCLVLEPEDRATLEEMQQHPWLNNPVPPQPQLPHPRYHHPQILHPQLPHLQPTHPQLFHAQFHHPQLTHPQFLHSELPLPQPSHPQVSHHQFLDPQLPYPQPPYPHFLHPQFVHPQVPHSQFLHPQFLHPQLFLPPMPHPQLLYPQSLHPQFPYPHQPTSLNFHWNCAPYLPAFVNTFM